MRDPVRRVFTTPNKVNLKESPRLSYEGIHRLFGKRFREHLMYALGDQRDLVTIDCTSLREFSSRHSAVCCFLMGAPISIGYIGLTHLADDLFTEARFHLGILGRLSDNIGIYVSLQELSECYLRQDSPQE